MLNFSLENSLQDANDLIQSYQLYKNNRPKQAVGHRVPVSSEITSTNIIHGAMDISDDNSSHDKILMLFQNQSDPGQSAEPQFSQSDNQQVPRKLITILDC